ncbi:MAG: U32 family peptidase [Bacteriovoracaceae bacterium]|nr:U32 family peptidase [Bacteriovoracaceae bacterium]
MKTAWKPELLAPAGNLEKLKVAISYGADAVYLGGQKFGLRAAADNFTYEELAEGVQFAHERGRQVYVVLNSFLHDKDLNDLPEFLTFLDSLKVDALIVSDLGVVETCLNYSQIPVHLSTQASCLNVEAAKFWKKMGVKRLIVGRELSIKEAGMLKRATELEVEMFIHGSMCMAYSGNCVISNYTQGRDSNRGGCAHSCRFEYSIDFKNEWQEVEKRKAYFMSSKDLMGVSLLEEFFKEGIDSVKVEGRMKGPLYAGTISKVYREALDYYAEHGNLYSQNILEWESELKKLAHRDYTTASLVTPAGTDSIFSEREGTKDLEAQAAAVVTEVVKDQHIIVEIKKAFEIGDVIEYVPFSGATKAWKVAEMATLGNQKIERTKPSTLVKLPYVSGIEALNIVRRKS